MMNSASPHEAGPPLPAPAHAERSRSGLPWWAVVGAGVLAVLYLAMIRYNCSSVASGSDESGYLNIARLLQSGQTSQPVPVMPDLGSFPEWDPLVQRPLGFTLQSEQHRIVPTYPVGYPLLLLLAAPVVGLDYATVLVNTVCAALAGALMLGLGRQLGLSWAWSLAGVALLWCCPLFVFMAARPMSDMPATVCTLAAISAALASRRHGAWGLAAGLALALAVLVRPSNALLILPVGLALGGRWRSWLALLLGGLPGALFLGWWNLRLYGTALTTGYGDVSTLFSVKYLLHNVAHFGIWIPLLGGPVVGLAAVGSPWWSRAPRSVMVLLLAWFAVFGLFYALYYHSGEVWWYLRFILPAFPAVIFAALLAGTNLARRLPDSRLGRATVPTLLAISLAGQGILGNYLDVLTLKHLDRSYLEAATWMKENVAPEAYVLQMQTSGSFTYYTSFTLVRWDYLNPERAQRLYRSAQAAGRPIYAALYDYELKELKALERNAPGDWERMGTFRQISVWRLRLPSAP